MTCLCAGPVGNCPCIRRARAQEASLSQWTWPRPETDLAEEVRSLRGEVEKLRKQIAE